MAWPKDCYPALGWTIVLRPASYGQWCNVHNGPHIHRLPYTQTGSGWVSTLVLEKATKVLGITAVLLMRTARTSVKGYHTWRMGILVGRCHRPKREMELRQNVGGKVSFAYLELAGWTGLPTAACLPSLGEEHSSLRTSQPSFWLWLHPMACW